MVQRPHDLGNRPGSGDHPLALDPQLSGEPHTPRTPVDPRGDELLPIAAERAALRIRWVAAHSASLIRTSG